VPKVKPPAIKKDERTYTELLTDYANAKPKQAAVDAEVMKVGGMLATAANPVRNMAEQ
jgi:hypothetical protein